MRRFLLSLALLLLCFYLSAQQRGEVNYDNYVKYWDEGPLNYGDFSARKNGLADGRTSYLDFGYTYRIESRREGNLVYDVWVIRSFMDKLKSWIVPDLCTPQVIQYNQTKFDIGEFVRRKYQVDINTPGADKAKVRNYYLSAFNSSLDAYEQETSYGADSSMVGFYTIKIKDQLAGLSDSTVPPYTEKYSSKGSWRLILGYCGSHYLGEAADYFKMANGFSVGFGFSFASHLWVDILTDFSGMGRLKTGGIKDNGYEWRTGKGVSATNVGTDISYMLLDKNYYALGPMLGVGGISISQDLPKSMQTQKETESSIGNWQFSAGISFHYKLRRYINASPSNETYTENNFGLKLYGAYSNLPVGAYSINLSLVWCPSFVVIPYK